jgi:7-cyano-7-deazaguanine synthase
MSKVATQSLSQTRPAVVLLSGGLDSATVLAMARNQGYCCHTLAFDYGQRHRHELDACAKIAAHHRALSHRVFELDMAQFGGSALTSPDIEVPKDRDESHMDEIPVTYVPARNLVFLSIALAYAETLGATDLFIGVNAIDYSGYPDCRPEFIDSFTRPRTSPRSSAWTATRSKSTRRSSISPRRRSSRGARTWVWTTR